MTRKRRYREVHFCFAGIQSPGMDLKKRGGTTLDSSLDRYEAADALSEWDYSASAKSCPSNESTFGWENLSQNKLSSVAAAEVYFKRPTARADGRIEYPSLFNPYWQARLTEPTLLQRAAALLL